MATFPAILCQQVSKAVCTMSPQSCRKNAPRPSDQTSSVTSEHTDTWLSETFQSEKSQEWHNSVILSCFFFNQIHKTEQMSRNTHTKMRQMHRDDSLWGKGWVASEATLALWLKIDENVLLFYGWIFFKQRKDISPSSLERNNLKELYNNKTKPKETSINMQKYPEHFNAS